LKKRFEGIFMCGVLGQIKIDGRINPDRGRFEFALGLLAHRGPDHQGVYPDRDFIFGHRRLSILDLSADAHQPMISPDGNVILVFNGEIYNYRELRETLTGQGYAFRTSGDTEVLLNGYHREGVSFFERCQGMFAAAVYDRRYGKAHLVRDRAGIKPLYYCRRHGRITFASEIKAILAFEDVPRKLNHRAVSSYLSFRYPVLDDTFFEEVHVLPPAHWGWNLIY